VFTKHGEKWVQQVFQPAGPCCWQ